MKLRIKGDSLRLRLSPSEMSRLLESGRIEETIHFGPQRDAKLTYALLVGLDESAQVTGTMVRYLPQEVAVVIPHREVQKWAGSTEIGIYASVDVGSGILDVAVEKDFACLDKSEPENHDTFPNPSQGAAC